MATRVLVVAPAGTPQAQPPARRDEPVFAQLGLSCWAPRAVPGDAALFPRRRVEASAPPPTVAQLRSGARGCPAEELVQTTCEMEKDLTLSFLQFQNSRT